MVSPGRFKVKLIEWIESDDECPYCALLCVALLDNEDNQITCAAVTFGDTVRVRKTLHVNKVYEFSICCFVETAQIWDKEQGFAPDSKWFIPLGPLAVLDSQLENAPRAHISGEVCKIQQITNSCMDKGFRLLTVKSFGGLYDAIIANDLLPDVDVGTDIEFRCWLFAGLANDDR